LLVTPTTASAGAARLGSMTGAEGAGTVSAREVSTLSSHLETGSPLPTHDGEPHTTGPAGRLNWLRAGVLGADDGIVSVAHRPPRSRTEHPPARPGQPAQAAGASALSFTLGALLPLVAILLPPDAWRVPVCVAAVLVALAVTGAVSARLGGSSPARAVLRVVVGGALGLAPTYGIGHLFGTAVG
jgi:hypothetical protein